MEVNGIGANSGPEPIRPNQPRRIHPPIQEPQSAGDKVEISDVARLQALLRDVPEIRVDRVSELRARIEAGTYETPDKIDGVVDEILKELE